MTLIIIFNVTDGNHMSDWETSTVQYGQPEVIPVEDDSLEVRNR